MKRYGSGTKDVLEVCKAVKLACARLYHHFADLFKADRDNLLLWLNTAMEEENHARLFALVDKLRHDDVIEAIRIDPAEAALTLKHVRSLTRKVKRNPPSMVEALRLAIELQARLDGLMVDNVITFAHDSFDKLFLPITNPENKHIEALQKAHARMTA